LGWVGWSVGWLVGWLVGHAFVTCDITKVWYKRMCTTSRHSTLHSASSPFKCSSRESNRH